MIKQIGSITLSLTIFFVLLFLYTKFAGPIPFSVNSVTTNKSSAFEVTGTGKASIKPDGAKVSAGVSATASSSADVQNQMNTIINRVSTAIKNTGVLSADIQTSNYNVNPTYDYLLGSQKINGYSANTNLIVTVKDVSKVNTVIDAATQAGATNVNNIGFNNSDTTGSENEARKLAIADAKKKASDIANLAGFKLGNIINYSENGNGAPGPIPFAAGGVADGKVVVPTQLEPGTNEVTINVTLSYEVK